jgi:hypothetical protein
MKKVKKERTGNAKGYIVAGILTALLAVGVYSLLVMAEKRILNPTNKYQCYAFAKDVAKGTEINDDFLYSGSIKVVEVEEDIIPKNRITDFEAIKGSYISCDVTENMLVTDSFIQNGITAGKKTITFAVSGITRATAGKLRANDKVDVYLITSGYRDESELEPTYTDVYLKDVYDGNGAIILNDDTKSLATTFSILVDDTTADAIVSKLAQNYAVWLVKTE